MTKLFCLRAAQQCAYCEHDGEMAAVIGCATAVGELLDMMRGAPGWWDRHAAQYGSAEVWQRTVRTGLRGNVEVLAAAGG